MLVRWRGPKGLGEGKLQWIMCNSVTSINVVADMNMLGRGCWHGLNLVRNQDETAHHGLGLLLPHSPQQLRRLLGAGRHSSQSQLFPNLGLPPNHLGQNKQMKRRKGQGGWQQCWQHSKKIVGRLKDVWFRRVNKLFDGQQMIDYGE